MFSISATSTPTSTPDPASRFDEPPNAIPNAARAGGSQSGRREIPPTIYRYTRSVAENPYGSGEPPIASQAARLQNFMAAIEHQMRTICARAQGQHQASVPGVVETLYAVKRCAQAANEAEKQALAAKLDNIMSSAASSQAKDVALLKTAIERTLRGEDPVEALRGIAKAKLILPDLSLLTAGQAEPSQRDFDSTLLSFTSTAYGHGDLGRTLLLEGAYFSFTGPSQQRRCAKLREVIFALPYPSSGGETLKGMGDILGAALRLKFDL